jgi:hypothetical protein
MAEVLVEEKFKVVADVSTPPPVLSVDDLLRLAEESDRLYRAFQDRTIGMEILTHDDLKIVVR